MDICDHFDDLGTDTATDFYRGCWNFYNGSGNVCGHRNPNSLYLKKSGLVEAMGQICVSDADLHNFSDLCCFFIFSRSSYLCVAVAFGGAVPTEEESVDHVFRE